MIDVQQTEVYDAWFQKIRDTNARTRITTRIQRLKQGNPGDVKPVGEGVSELRINYGPGYRVYFVQQGQSRITLLTGGDKDTQNQDIKVALDLATRL